MTSLYDPSHIRRWFLDKQRPKDLDQIRSAHQAVIIRESEKACQVQWLAKAGEIVYESWVPKSAIELKEHAMKRIAGENALKTELREWMWQRGMPSDGAESVQELQNVVLWQGTSGRSCRSASSALTSSRTTHVGSTRDRLRRCSRQATAPHRSQARTTDAR